MKDNLSKDLSQIEELPVYKGKISQEEFTKNMLEREYKFKGKWHKLKQEYMK